jgi:hypothetical protein
MGDPVVICGGVVAVGGEDTAGPAVAQRKS